MPVLVKVARSSSSPSLLFRVLRAALVVVLAFAVLGGLVFAWEYHRYAGLVDQRLAQGPLFASTAQIYAAPQEVRPGQHLSAETIAAHLRRAGYDGANNPMGSVELSGDTVRIKPGAQSYLAADGATISTPDGVVESITAENGAQLAAYKLEPQLITALSEDKNRTKRRMVTYDGIPPRLVQAVLAIEDRRFFEHSGINYVRTIKCGVQDILSQHKACGGSTLTQQLARGFFLTPQKTISRKVAEIMITYQLEGRFNKQQIFEMYANEINLGQRGSFSVNGFGEAAQAYFGKPLKQLDLAECATLAAMIQRPNFYNPYRHPERTTTRRNLVIDSMVETGAITAAQAQAAKDEPIRLAPAEADASEAPYFVDLVHDQITQRIGDYDSSHSSLRIYTSLDPDLQKAAAEAVEVGMKRVDALVAANRKRGIGSQSSPQVALVALNPHTGQVLALVGGRNYAASQLNHAVAKRPTGSIFKPFVYATAEEQAVDGQTIDGQPFTALTTLHDVQQTFSSGSQSYSPRNYMGEYHGDVSAIYALAHSLNNATVSLGQQVGFGNVAALGRASGVASAKGTPAVSLGAYDASPLDMAGAYTVFANSGVHLTPWLLSGVRNTQGDVVADYTPDAKQVMNPKAAFLTQSLLEGVMNFGYGVAVRKLGFRAPAAGKTGTDNDAWFAAYTSNLICIVWVGNDDYSDIKLQGATAAAPIWAEFMNRAAKLPQYSDMKPLGPVPDGIQIIRVDRTSNLPADESCPSDTFSAAFLVGTVPQSTCSHMGLDPQTLGNQLFGDGTNSGAPIVMQGNPSQPGAQRSPYSTVPGAGPQQPRPVSPYDLQPNAGQQPQATEPKHRNAFQKLFGIGKDKHPRDDDGQPPQ